MPRPAKTRVRHGMASCVRYGCDRPECRRAENRSRRQYRADVKRGRRAVVDAAPAAGHARALIAAGMPAAEIARWTGLSVTTVTGLVSGRRTTTYRVSAEAILALPAPGRDYRSPADGLVDATAARRRLRALSVRGFTLPVLAAQTGVTEETVGSIRQGRRAFVRVSVNQAVTAAYNRLWNADPLAHGATLSGYVRAKSWAARQGWAPPAAWDDDEIADPRAWARGAVLPRQGGRVA